MKEEKPKKYIRDSPLLPFFLGTKNVRMNYSKKQGLPYIGNLYIFYQIMLHWNLMDLKDAVLSFILNIITKNIQSQISLHF